MDWFHSITSSVSPDHMTPPIITSTQENLNRSAIKHSNSHCDIQSNTDSPSDRRGPASSAAEGPVHSITNTDEQCVVQKMSKNLRDRRLRDLELNQRRSDMEGGGGHRDRRHPKNTASKNVTDPLNPTSGSHSSSTSTLPSAENDQIQGNQSLGKKQGAQSRTKSMCAVLREKVAAEAQTDLHSKLSDFVFKPRKKRLSLNSELQNECSGDRPLTGTERNKTQKLNRREHVSCEKEEGQIEDGACFPPTEQDVDDFSCGKDKAVRLKQSHDTDLDQQQRPRLNTANEPVADGPSGSPPSNSKSTVVSSTLAKLSRFSFIHTNPPPAGSSKGHGAECSTANSDVNTTPEQSSSTGKTRPVVTMGPAEHVSPPLVSRLPPGQEPERGLDSQTKTNSLISDGPAHCDGSVNLKKRKCFELTLPSSLGVSKGPFSGLSLFGSGELANNLLDTDWDQEVSKKIRL